MELPRFLQVEPVGQCNLRCRMCPVQFRDAGGPGRVPAFMDFAVFCRLIDQFPRLSELHLQGMGEPLLHPRFFDMVRYAADKGIRVSANSNLTALSERRAAECIASGLHEISVSLDAASPAGYEAIRVGARQARVLRNLDRLLQARREAAATLPRVRLVAVAMRTNLHELPDLVHLAHGHGVDALFVQHLCHDFDETTLPERYRAMRDFVDSETLAQEDPDRIARYFNEARDAAARLGVTLRLPAPRPRPHPRERSGAARCDWPWRGSYVSYAGDAMPCCIVATPDRISFGNMVREGAEQVWNNDAYRQFRQRLAEGPPPEVCRGCAVYKGTF